MSTPSRIFNEQIFEVDSSSSGSKIFEFQVENDGFILSINHISGVNNSVLTVTHIMPDDMRDLELERIVLTSEQTQVRQFGYIAGRRASVRVVWTGATNIIFSVRAVSAEAVKLVTDNTSTLLKENNVLLNRLIGSVQENSEINKKVLNHLRTITEINEDVGEEY